jgi:hypothetical protein
VAKKAKDDRPQLYDDPLNWWAWCLWCWLHKHNWWRLRRTYLRLLGDTGGDDSIAEITAFFDIEPTTTGGWCGHGLWFRFRDGEVSILAEDGDGGWNNYKTFDMNQSTPADIATFLRTDCGLVGRWTEPDRVPHGYTPYPDKLPKE